MLKLNVVILAAGAGKRMHSSLPKVLHTLAGQPLLTHVINTARKLSPNKICVVIGHDGEKIKKSVIGDDLTWVIQEQQLGTGHALMQALSQLSDDGLTLILYGDVPLVSAQELRQLLIVVDGKSCAMLSAVVENPFGYGRIVRDVNTKAITAIVEQKDASTELQSIHEINTGIMLIPNVYLHKWLPKLKNKNTQHEYYLTDIIAMAFKDGVHVASVQVKNFWEVMGVNNKYQLAELERLFQRNCANELLSTGVRVTDPARIDIRGELICGSDVEIDINCIFEGTVKLGNFVRVGAHCILRNVTVAAGSIIHPYSMIEGTEISVKPSSLS